MAAAPRGRHTDSTRGSPGRCGVPAHSPRWSCAFFLCVRVASVLGSRSLAPDRLWQRQHDLKPGVPAVPGPHGPLAAPQDQHRCVRHVGSGRQMAATSWGVSRARWGAQGSRALELHRVWGMLAVLCPALLSRWAAQTCAQVTGPLSPRGWGDFSSRAPLFRIPTASLS